MRIVIGAAGRGTRFKELTREQPKILIPINGKPYLYYILQAVEAAGFTEIVLVVGYQAEKIVAFLASYPNRITIKLVNQYEKLGAEKYGTACLLECVQEQMGQDNFVLLYGDNLYSSRDLHRFILEDNNNYIAGYPVTDYKKYGILLSDGDNYLKEIIEKPQAPVGNLANCGLYKFNNEIFKYLKKIKKSPRGEYELTDAISLLAKKRKVKVVKLLDYWLDLGAPEDIEKVERFVQKL